MRKMSRAIVRLSTAGFVSMLALGISAVNAQEAGAQVIGTVNSRAAQDFIVRIFNSGF